jgi:hypothetical protein
VRGTVGALRFTSAFTSAFTSTLASVLASAFPFAFDFGFKDLAIVDTSLSPSLLIASSFRDTSNTSFIVATFYTYTTYLYACSTTNIVILISIRVRFIILSSLVLLSIL